MLIAQPASSQFTDEAATLSADSVAQCSSTTRCSSPNSSTDLSLGVLRSRRHGCSGGCGGALKGLVGVLGICGAMGRVILLSHFCFSSRGSPINSQEVVSTSSLHMNMSSWLFQPGGRMASPVFLPPLPPRPPIPPIPHIPPPIPPPIPPIPPPIPGMPGIPGPTGSNLK